MNTLVCTEPGHLAYKDRPAPAPAPGYALLKIKHIGICGTDLHAFEGTQPFFAYPRVPGHELAAALVHGQGLSFDELTLVEPLAIGARRHALTALSLSKREGWG